MSLVDPGFVPRGSRPSWWNLLIVFPFALGTVWQIHEFTAEKAVAGREKTAPGTIASHEPANHNRYGYRFNVGGKAYSGWDSSGEQSPRIGKQVLVYYDPIDPAMNALVDFASLEYRSLAPAPWEILGISAVAFFIAHRRHRNLAERAESKR